MAQEITQQDIQTELAQRRAKIRARQDRIRREEIELEKEQADFVARGNAFFVDRLNSYREQAITYALAAAAALATVPAAPQKPDPSSANDVGFDEYMRRAAAFPGELEAHRKQALAAGAPFASALRGLIEMASAARRECRSLGFRVFEGVAFIRDDQRKPRPGTAMIAFTGSPDLLGAVANAAEAGALTAAHASALIELLREPAPQTPTHPEDSPARIWERVSKASDERELAREMAERAARGEGGRPEAFRGEHDVNRYVDGLARTGGGR